MKFDAVPIVIGVTGHRAIAQDAQPALRAKFADVLDGYATRYAASAPPLVLCGLAAGADILAAEVALERNVPVIACLPAAQETYERDFSDEERERFRNALSRCSGTIVVGNGEHPTRGYADLASFLVYYSAVIVAFWDGSAGRGAGGTADLVRMREASPDLGPVLHIVTPRSGEPPPHDAFAVREIYAQRPTVDLETHEKRRHAQTPLERDRAAFEKVLSNLDRFNADVASTGSPSSAAASLEGFQLAADRAADRLQKWTLQSLRWLYIVGGIAIAAQLVVQQPLTQISPVATGIRFGLLAIAGVWFRFAKRQDYENRYQDYRAIAEALRVQQAWCSAGLRDRLVEASYLQMQQSELQWIRLALRTIYLISGARDARPSDSLAHPDCAAWVGGQHAYYEKAARVQVRAQRRIFRASSTLMGIGGAISALAVIASLLRAGVGPIAIHAAGMHLSLLAHKWSLYSAWPGLHAAGNLAQWLLYFMTVPASLLGMIVLLLQFYAQQRGYAENARRYQRMFEVFDLASRRLADPSGDRAQVLTALGHEALSEHADWLILHRERPMRVISGITHVQAAPRSQR